MCKRQGVFGAAEVEALGDSNVTKGELHDLHQCRSYLAWSHLRLRLCHLEVTDSELLRGRGVIVCQRWPFILYK